MTRARIVRLIERHARQLKLTAWKIEVDLSTKLPGEQDAEVRWDWSYDNATVVLAADKWPAWDEAYARKVIVHELLHIVTRDLCVCVAEVSVTLPKAAQRLARDRWEHELEGVIERLAVVLVDQQP